MLRLAPAGILLFLVAVAAYAASFYATKSVLAHGPHCGGSYPCNILFLRYYAGRYVCCAFGFAGAIDAMDVDLWDGDASGDCINDQFGNPGCDWVSHYVSLSKTGPDPSADQMQMGWTEGLFKDPPGSPPPTIFTSPRIYEELNRTACEPTYALIDRGTTSSLWNQFFMYWSRIEGPCPGGGYTYVMYLKLGDFGNPILDFTYHPQPYGRLDAMTEHLNNTHIEPNGTICFGSNTVCSPSTPLGLRFYDPYTQSWSLWTPPSDVYYAANMPYDTSTMAYYYSHYSYGSLP